MTYNGIKAAVVGVGFIGAAHVEALRRLGVEVVGVMGSSPERAATKAEALGVGRVYATIDEMAADPDVDVIHITSPNYAHADQARTVLAAGKHVVCEKPLALSSADTADLVARAEASGLVNAVCFNIRFYPANHQAMSMVAAGEIGEPRFITGSYHQDWLLLDTDWNWRLQSEQAGKLRAVADIGSHWFGPDPIHIGASCGRGDGGSAYVGAGASPSRRDRWRHSPRSRPTRISSKRRWQAMTPQESSCGSRTAPGVR